MRIETEIKLCLNDLSRVLGRLNSLKANLVEERHFEDNHVLDFPDRRIRSEGCLLRVRVAGRKCFLTYKAQPRREGIFKSRGEVETEVEDGQLILEILQRLGMEVWFRYQKYREEYSLSVPGGGVILAALDETPIGVYVELEGAEPDIRAAASALGFDESTFLRDSYYSLYLRHCAQLGEVPGHMLFS